MLNSDRQAKKTYFMQHKRSHADDQVGQILGSSTTVIIKSSLYFYKNFVIRDNLPNFRSTENKNYGAGLGALMLICVALLSIEEQAFVQMG